ncbi:hypothetical protein E2320_019191 [Naja naja]|nr:hypothetical protein E2320_019191 [Naja naja]
MKLSSELVAKTFGDKMDSGDIAVGQNATSRTGEAAKVSSRWRQEHLANVKMGSLEGQAQMDPEHMGSPASSQLFSSGKGVSPSNATQQITDKQYPQQLPSPYSCPHSLSFPQPSLPQGFLHNLKPRQSLEGHKWQFSGPLQPVASEDLFPFHVHGHSGSFSRKKVSNLNPAYSQYSQKCIEQSSEDGYKKEHKPKKPGKYICPYCSRACAKPSVLKKHIRSHTGERPYPCVPCGFSFKTKSNLYKHRKSHAHAIKAGLVPFTESAVSKLDLDSSFIDVEAEIHSDGEQSTDTDEETSLLIESSDKLSPVPQLPLDVASRSGFHASLEESLGGPMKVPILIIPRSGVPLPCESSLHAGTDNLQNPLNTKSDDSHTVKQRLALRLSEKKGQDSDQSLNLLSPHSKGSTDSGYFSRSESAEQQISPPNTNVKSYEEIIFGKFYRINQRTAQPLATANQDCNSMGRKGKMEPLPLVNPRLDINLSEERMSPNNEALMDSGNMSTMKNSQVFDDCSSESKQLQIVTSSIKNESSLYPGSHLGDASLLLEPSADTNPLIRSNSMPTSSATNLNVPSSLRGSHSFDERMTGSDDVFYPETIGIPHQRMLIRQAAFELPSLQEGHSDSEYHGRMGKNIMVASIRSPVGEKGPGMREKKLPAGERHIYEGDSSGKHYRKWEDYGILKQSFSGSKQSGDYTELPTQLQAMSSTYGIVFENRKRRIQKSVGDEEDTPSLCSGVSSNAMTGDFDPKSQTQDGPRSGYAIQSHDSTAHCHSERFEMCRPHLQSCSPTTSLEECSAADQEKATESLSRKGNVISVIQHTNSLSRPNSFERSESTELVTCQQEKSYLTSESFESEVAEFPMSPERVQQIDNADVASKQPSSLQPFQTYMQPRLVRQHNIQVPEIRVTEEPDKPEKEREVPVKEQEKPAEEFQWPQRSETLSQLPAEKLPPKKKRLRLADMEHSSGESSFESTGTSLSRSPSQESNLSHSSSFSMSFEREDSIRFITSTKQDELVKQPEFLTVPAGAYSLSVPGHHQQKEMRRCSSEQMPCPYPAEIPEIRSKSFDYGNLSHVSAAGAPPVALSPVRERKKCFLVRQASFSGSPEIPQADSSMEQNIKQEQTEHGHTGLRSSQTPWSYSSFSLPSDDSRKQATGSCPPRSTSLSPLSHLSVPQAPYILSKYPAEQQHLFALQEKIPFFPIHSTILQFPYPSVCMVHLPSQPLWPSEISQTPFPHHFVQQLQKSYSKQPFPMESHPGCHLECAQEHIRKKPDYVCTKEQPYQRYSGTSGQYSKNALATYQPDCSIKSTDTSSEQQLQVNFETQNIEPVQSLPGTVVPVRLQTHVPSYGSVMYTSISQILAQSSSPAIVICKVDETLSQRTLATSSSMHGIGFNIAQMLNQHGGLEKYPLWKVPQTLSLNLDSSIPLCLTSSSDTASTLGGNKRMLSPASSLELFMETKQQKRVKDEKMYGQIVEELSAVELTSSDIKKSFPRPQKPQLMKQEPFFVFGSKFEKKVAGNVIKERIKGDSHGDKDIVAKQTEPMRIKIFEGGYKSNEDYVYVRGRGRGKYICEECGIRCKKPSMLKKHIRTHTDVRPYVCKLCNFAFKTKGNLTKHMKSKAHMKKCLELGVSMTSVDDTETEEAENMEDNHQEIEKNNLTGTSTEHQFSDAEESDGEDGEDNDEDDEDDDDFDDALGDSTPKTRSRSTSPQPPRFSSLSVNTATTPYGGSPESAVGHSSLISYLVTLPSIQVTHLLSTSDSCDDSPMTEYQRFFQNKSTDSEPDKDRLDIPSCMDEDYMISLESNSSPRELSSSSQQSSPGYDSSPYRDNSPKRYLIPKGDLSPRRHLSPRREISPIRHISPRKEAVLRRELSPRRDASPRRHLSPRRSVSPGKDASSRREMSPRRERRYMASIRAASPRRGLYHNPSLPLGQYMQSESLPLGHSNSRAGLLEAPYFNLPGEKGILEHHIPNLFPEGPTDYVFSHLPLHSQQQLRAPIPMMPIGGIQIVHSLPAALSGLHTPSIWSLSKESSEEKQWESCTPPKHQERRARPPSLQAMIQGSALTSELLLMKKSTSEEGGVMEREQEENLQTCTKAIASLRIATEEILHGTEQTERDSEPFRKPLESAHFSMEHFSGSEPGQICASATNPDLHSSEKDLFGTSQQTVVSHSTFYSKSSVEVRPLSVYPSRKDSSTQERRESPSEKSKPQ